MSARACASVASLLTPGEVIALLEPGHLLGIQPVHLIAGRDQRLHPQAPVTLDRDLHLTRITVLPQVPGDQLMQGGDPRRALRQPPGSRLPPSLVLDLHIMVVLGAVIPGKQHFRPPERLRENLHEQPAGERLAP
jgi:hypothetical protein